MFTTEGTEGHEGRPRRLPQMTQIGPEEYEPIARHEVSFKPILAVTTSIALLIWAHLGHLWLVLAYSAPRWPLCVSKASVANRSWSRKNKAAPLAGARGAAGAAYAESSFRVILRLREGLVWRDVFSYGQVRSQFSRTLVMSAKLTVRSPLASPGQQQTAVLKVQ